MEVQVATTCKCGEIHERFSEPRNSTELEYRTLSRRCYCRSCRQRRALLEMRQCPLYTYWWGRGKKPALGCQRKVETGTNCYGHDCLRLLLGPWWHELQANRKFLPLPPASLLCFCALCQHNFTVNKVTKWQRRNKFTNS